MPLLESLTELSRIPERIVSLVPSMTESLFDLGLGGAVVGVSDYCTRPEGRLSGISRIGGPKTIDIAQVLALHPDLVIANREENEREAVLALAEQTPVWAPFPLTVQDVLRDLWALAYLGRSQQALMRMRLLESAVEMAEESLENEGGVRYFCPVWQGQAGDTRWWMTFNQECYSSDLLRLLGGVNCFAQRERRNPLAADLDTAVAAEAGAYDRRYPRVTRAEILTAQPDVILLPDEPFAYSQHHVKEFRSIFAQTPAVKQDRIVMVDGSLITWGGTRLGLALSELADVFRAG
ncbi:MAG: ABC transporter substrate-binding protein [Bellilinea sp.]